jgi:hypothetical protein
MSSTKLRKKTLHRIIKSLLPLTKTNSVRRKNRSDQFYLSPRSAKREPQSISLDLKRRNRILSYKNAVDVD